MKKCVIYSDDSDVTVEFLTDSEITQRLTDEYYGEDVRVLRGKDFERVVSATPGAASLRQDQMLYIVE